MKRFFSRRNDRRLSGKSVHEIAPDEIFLDSSNLPNFDTYQFEGRIEKPISRRTMLFAGLAFFLICVTLLSRTWVLQVKKGEAYSILSERNSLLTTTIFAPRGLIQDRNQVTLVSNKISTEHPEYPSREYRSDAGLAHLLGYVNYPKKDSSGVYYRLDYSGKDGVEAYYNDLLTGENGTKITERNALGAVESESVIKPAHYGMNVVLSIDSKLQSALYGYIKSLADSNGFASGGAVVMDVETGEIVAMTSFPEFDSTVMSEGTEASAINGYLADKRQPFLDRVVTGLYTPGSIVKPFLAAGVLNEGIIDPKKAILSTGSISIPNPYAPEKKSVFNDWKAHGWVDMREAIAVSSDVYFYEVGGGFEDQQGLGIANIKKYMQLFGFGQAESDNYLLGTAGTLPDPDWKKAHFNGEIWRIGDTYNTAIGQYGMQVTPIQVVRAVAALANGGKLLEPTVLLNGNQSRSFSTDLGLSQKDLTVVKEGMRDAVLYGTAKNLDIPEVAIAAKTGTAELGSKKQFVNSWVEGFFPYEHPRYAFAAVMEKGPHDNTVGALYVMRQFFEWLSLNAPGYLQ